MTKDAVHQFLQDVLRVQAELGHFPARKEYEAAGKYGAAITLFFGNWGGVERAAKREVETSDEPRTPKMLVFDVETALMHARIFSPKTEYVRHKQVTLHSAVIAFAAKWLGDPPSKLIYHDQRNARDLRDDKALLKVLWGLLDEADMVVTKNGKRFDTKFVNYRFEYHRMGQPSPYAHEDIEQLFRRHFRLPYYNLDFLCEHFQTKVRKLDHGKFPSQELWEQCEAGNPEAWREMERYNRNDVLATEELRARIAPWGSPSINLNLFHGDAVYRCESCGGTDLIKRGVMFRGTSKYTRFSCNGCGRWGSRKGAGNNLFSLKKKMSLKGPA